MAKATSGNAAQFTYDFGIAIAQGTIRKLERLTGTTLSLASAYYAVQKTSKEYISTLRENTVLYGGLLNTILAMEQAQNRLMKGQTFFDTKDQLTGMRQLQAAGVDVQKNFEWINKSAHAMGKSYTEFAGAISNAIAGNMSGLVEMGLLTQRATRMFEKYGSNTIMREKAIINFLRQHKGLQQAVANDFETIQDQIKRFVSFFRTFIMGMLGKPNDPGGLYGTIVGTLHTINDALAGSTKYIKNAAFFIGETLSFVVRNVGHFVMWLGRQVKKVADWMGLSSDNFAEKVRSIFVWLEFWKVYIVNFVKRYQKEIKLVILATLALGAAWKVLGKDFLMFRAMGNGVFASLGKSIMALVRIPLVALTNALRVVGSWLLKIAAYALANPYVLIVTAVIAAVVTLYKKFEGVRRVINTVVGIVVESLKIVWNTLNMIYIGIRVAIRKVWGWVSDLFTRVVSGISKMWKSFMNTKVGQWLKTHIIDPLKTVFKWILEHIISPIKNFFLKTLPNLFGWLRNKNKDYAEFVRSVGDQNGIAVAPIGSKTDKPVDEVVNKDYLSFGKSSNPILDTSALTPNPPQPKDKEATTMNFGDIKIMVEGGKFDETKLAQKIKEVIFDLQRQGAVRAGM